MEAPIVCQVSLGHKAVQGSCGGEGSLGGCQAPWGADWWEPRGAWWEPGRRRCETPQGLRAVGSSSLCRPPAISHATHPCTFTGWFEAQGRLGSCLSDHLPRHVIAYPTIAVTKQQAFVQRHGCDRVRNRCVCSLSGGPGRPQ